MLNSTKQRVGKDHQNFFNPSQSNDSIMVTHDGGKFTFYSKAPLGHFTINQLIKYIGKQQYNEFMTNIDIDLSKEVIETFIVKVHENEIHLINYIQSPFMGNIEMLILLEKDITNYEKNILVSETNKISDQKIQKRVIRFIKEFIYLIQNHMVRLIATLSDHIKNDPSRTKIKENLLGYSNALVYKISKYVICQLDQQKETINNLQENQCQIVKIKNVLNNKIESLAKTIDDQCVKMESLSNKLDAMLMRPSISAGGSRDLNLKESDNIDLDDDNPEGGSNASQSSDIIEEIFNFVLPKSISMQSAGQMMNTIQPSNPIAVNASQKLTENSINDIIDAEKSNEHKHGSDAHTTDDATASADKNAKLQTKKMGSLLSEEVIMAPISDYGKPRKNKNQNKKKDKIDISNILDSENGYRSESPGQNQKAMNYISSENVPQENTKSSRDTDKSIVGEIYNM